MEKDERLLNDNLNSDEKELLQKSKNGDSKAFSLLLKKHLSMIYNIAYKMTGNPEDSSDMTQETMIKLFKSIDSFNFQSKFSTWVYKVTVNTCLDEIKKQKRRMTFSLNTEKETEDGTMSYDIEDPSPTPEESLKKKEVKELISKALLKLSEEHRGVIILKDIKGMGIEEVAKILGCSEGTVKSRLSRGRKKLKEVLEKDFKIDGTYFKE